MKQFAHIEGNLQQVRARIAAAARSADRDPDEITLIAVTKAVGVEDIRVLRDLGVRHFGENRVELAQSKRRALDDPSLIWHMIGNVQRRKVRDVLQVFDRIDAVDRLSLAETLQARCQEADGHAEVLIEVNVSGETQKLGIAPEALPGLLENIVRMDRVHARGLMTMAPFDAASEEILALFRRLASLTMEHGLPDISMGMSNDFELAIAAGATEIRVGSALFERS